MDVISAIETSNELKQRNKSSTQQTKYWISFASPFFIVRVKMPGTNHWQLVRTQEAAQPINTAGASTVKVHGVMVFSSTDDAVYYCEKVLGLKDQTAPAVRGWLGMFFHGLFSHPETVEAIKGTSEVIEVIARNEVKPNLYARTRT